MKIFVSYCHRQGSWVCGSLVPCLKAGGADVLIDTERFRAGHALVGEMDAVQDAADKTLAVLSSDYLASEPCRHELERAIARDPEFTQGLTVPVTLEECTLPDSLRRPNPLWVDLRDRRSESGWRLLLGATGVDLGCKAVRWLEARDEIVTLLKRNSSVNFVVRRAWAPKSSPKWRQLLWQLKEEYFPKLGFVDLESGTAATREGLVRLILGSLDCDHPVRRKPYDLAALHDSLSQIREPRKLALINFDMAASRHKEYGIDFYASIRNLVEERRAVLLIQSRNAYANLAPREHGLSDMQLSTVELE